MKLYYSPGACSLASHIVLCELGLPHELAKVNLKTHTLADGGTDFYTINAKGYVPALQLDGGPLLTEGPAIMQYLAEQHPQAGLLPPAASLERAQVQSWLTYTGTEIHKNFGPLFNPSSTDDSKAAARSAIEKKLTFVDGELANKTFLVGDAFSVADAYLFVVAGWAAHAGLDLANWPSLQAFHQRVAARPAVQQAMKAEGLI